MGRSPTSGVEDVEELAGAGVCVGRVAEGVGGVQTGLSHLAHYLPWQQVDMTTDFPPSVVLFSPPPVVTLDLPDTSNPVKFFDHFFSKPIGGRDQHVSTHVQNNHYGVL